MSKDIEHVQALIERDSKEPLGEAPNLLLIHHELFRLEEFKDQTLLKAKSQGPAVMQIVTRFFKKLDALSESFRDYLFALSKNFLSLIRENQGSVVVKVLKIVEAEERADERVIASEQIRSNNPELSEAGHFKVLELNPRTIKNYRSQMFNAVHDGIAETFYRMLADTDKDAVTVLTTARFAFDDLALVFDELVPRFPAKYKVFSFFVLQYHKHVYDLCNRLVNRNMETREILFMTSWVRDYYTVMGERLGVTEELLEPRLLDDNEGSLTQEYIKLIRSKLMEWVDRLAETEMHEFILREKPPDSDGEQLFCTSAAVILFQMINQQIDIAADAARGGQLLLDVVIECFQIATLFQEKQLKVFDSEAHKFFHSNANDDVPGGFPEYVMAWCNNHLKCTEFMEVLQKRLEKELEEKYQATASKHVSETLDGFMKVARRGYQILMDIVFHDVTPVFQQLHTPPWYDQQLIPTILHTMDDYFRDFKVHLADYLFSKLTTEAMDKFLSLYIESMRGKTVKFKMPQAVSLMKADQAAITQFWTEYKTAKRVKQSTDLVEKITGIIESSSSMIFLSWYNLWKSYNDVPMNFIEDLLYKRDDLDKASIKEALSNCKAKAKEGNPEAVVSLFSKIHNEK